MDLKHILGLILVVVAIVVIWKIYNKEEKENSLVRWILLFDKKTKKFSEQRSDEFEEEEDVCMIGSNTHPLLHSFNRFIASECYHITTHNQAKRVFDIYLKSRNSNIATIKCNHDN